MKKNGFLAIFWISQFLIVALLGIPREFAVLAGFAVRSPEKGLRLILRPTLSLDPPLIVRAKKN